MTKEKLISYSVPVVGGAFGILIGLILYIYPKTVEDNSYYEKSKLT